MSTKNRGEAGAQGYFISKGLFQNLRQLEENLRHPGAFMGRSTFITNLGDILDNIQGMPYYVQGQTEPATQDVLDRIEELERKIKIPHQRMEKLEVDAKASNRVFERLLRYINSGHWSHQADLRRSLHEVLDPK